MEESNVLALQSWILMGGTRFSIIQYEILDFQIFGIIPLAFPTFPLYVRVYKGNVGNAKERNRESCMMLLKDIWIKFHRFVLHFG